MRVDFDTELLDGTPVSATVIFDRGDQGEIYVTTIRAYDSRGRVQLTKDDDEVLLEEALHQ